MRNKFKQNIENEEIASLPLGRFEGRIVVVDDLEKARKACEDLLSHEVIGFDTETRPKFKPGPLNKVALLQLSTPDCCYLFRLNKIPLDKCILKVLESKKTIKVGADIANDFKSLNNLRHFKVAGTADLQSIVSEWGIAEKSVRKMAGIILGQRISKAQRLSNWEAESLTGAQQLYAATDAWVCLCIYQKLMKTGKKPVKKQMKQTTDIKENRD